MIPLLDEHNRRIRAIDPRVAPSHHPPQGELLGGIGPAAVWLRDHAFEPDAPEAAWGPLCRHDLRIRVAAAGVVGAFDQALRRGLDAVQHRPHHHDDCAATVTWPSLDTVVQGVLLGRGFAPVTVLAMRLLGQREPTTAEEQVRPARAGDLDWLTDQAEQLHDLEHDLGVLPRRPHLRDQLREELTTALHDDHLLVHDSRSGFIHAQPPRGAWIEQQVTPAPAAYLSRLFVTPPARGAGVATSLIAAAQARLAQSGARAALLHHSVHNALAAPMWSRAGYWPVLTTWRIHPSLLRTNGTGLFG